MQTSSNRQSAKKFIANAINAKKQLKDMCSHSDWHTDQDFSKFIKYSCAAHENSHMDHVSSCDWAALNNGTTGFHGDEHIDREY